MTRVRYAGAALDELDAAVDYYSKHDVDLAERFHEDLRELEQRVVEAPLSYPVFEQVGNLAVRRALLEDFPFALLYVAMDDLPWIVAVMHLHREPGYWRRRV